MPASPPTEQEWHDERIRNYLLISRKVQDLQTDLQAVETAIRALGARLPNIDISTAASRIFDYNFRHGEAVQTNLESITDLNIAREAFQRSRQQAKEIYEILWCEEDELEWEVMAQLIEVRGTVRQLIEVDLVAWERRQGEVAVVEIA